MKKFEELFELINEAVSAIVWHYTNSPLKILKSDIFSLSTEQNSDVTKGGKAFFMSTARSKLGSYSNSPSGVIFKLDGTKLNQKYSGKSVDYWSGSGIKNRESGESEMEDRVYSSSPIIENAVDYILEIQCWLSESQKKDKSAYLVYLKKVEKEANSKNIPIKFFDGYSNFIQNKDPKSSLDDIIDTSDITSLPSYKSKYYKDNQVRKFLNFILALKDDDSNYRYYDSGLTLSNQYHNSFKLTHNKVALYGKTLISKLLKKLKLKNIDQLIKLRLEQYNKLRRSDDDINYLKRTYNTFVKDMKSGRDYDFDTIYNLTKNDGMLSGVPNSYEKLIHSYRKSDEEGLWEVFKSGIREIEDSVEKIKKTLVPIKLKSPRPKKTDYSWRDNQI